MPVHWYAICLTHLAARLWCLNRASRSQYGEWFPFLTLYLKVGLADLVVWIAAAGGGPVPKIIAPFLILAQIAAVWNIASKIHFLAPNHPIDRHYKFAYCIGLVAIAATARAVNYPEYPEWLFRAQLWVNVGTAAGIVALMALWWRRPFRMYPEVLWIALVMVAWVAVRIWAATQHIPTRAEGFVHEEILGAWVRVDEVVQVGRAVCLVGWGGIFRPTASTTSAT